MANQFAEWKRTLSKQMRAMSAPVAAPVSLEATQNRATGVPDLEKVLSEFALDFMGNFFVEEVFRPAFFMGQGIGGAGAGAVAEHMPQIDQGWSMWMQNQHGNGETGSVDEEGKYRKRGKTLEELIKEQEADDKTVLTADEISAKEQRRRENLTAEDSIWESAGAFDAEMGALVGKWAQGFKTLFASMSKVQLGKGGGNAIQVNMGPAGAILGQELNTYSITRGALARPSEFNSFFYAAEFGTGVARNVGGPQWVREQKKDGAEERNGMRGEPGSWWFWGKHSDGTDRGGGLFSGQKGLHVLFDEQTRAPRSIYQQWIRDNLQSRLTTYLDSATSGRIRASRR